VTSRKPDNTASIHVAVPPDRLWPMIADITRMGEYSPETYRCNWVGGARAPAKGARFRGWNRYRGIRWYTTCAVEECERGRAFAFCTMFLGARGTLWRYQFEADKCGTLLTETRTKIAPPFWARLFSTLVIRGHEESVQEGMEQTLERIREVAETSR
jgi:hypothetical protein